MPNTPLNPDALEAAADAVVDASFGQELPEAPIDLATAAVSAYLTVAQPEVNGVVDVPATMTCIAWEKEPEHGLWKISEDETFVGLIVKAGRSWSPADKYTLRIERPEVDDA